MSGARIGSGPLHDALTQVHDALVERAGDDQRVDEAELAAALATVPEGARQAVDTFARGLSAKHSGVGLFTVTSLEEAIAELRKGLPALQRDVPLSVDAAEVKRFGEGLLALARRLEGEPGAVLPPLPHEALDGLEGDELIAALREGCSRHLALRYHTARALMYGFVDNEDGSVECVYTGREVPVSAIKEGGMNAEHTLPQSRGARELPAKSDLHHLFPTDSVANNERAAHPFGVVVKELWREGDAKLGLDASGQKVFEPPDEHKGNVARALFYMAAVYGVALPEAEERVLRAWHGDDPVDDDERRRNDAVSTLQGNRNPFIDHDGLIERIDDI